MNQLIRDSFNFLKNNGFDFAFCGGHALDIHLDKITRPHGDIDISAFWEDRNSIIKYMQSEGWTVYEACGGGIIHLIKDTDDQKLIKLNIFCVKDNCLFFHTEPLENDMYRCDIDHVEQTDLDYIEFLFNKRDENHFIYSRNNNIQLELNKAIINKEGISYFSPELVLLYKSSDLTRKENRKDFDITVPYLSAESKHWLIEALKTAYPNGHEWIKRLEETTEYWDILDEHGGKTGRLHKRGKPMQKGDYHLVVQVWIMNSKNEFLISKRAPNIGNIWQTTGGCAVAGDDSLKSALKEAVEEIGVTLNPINGQLFKRYISPHTNDEGNMICDVWLFRQEIDISTIVLQPEETCDAMWATKEKIIQMIDEGIFNPSNEWYPYLNELFYFCDKPFWEIGYKDMTASTFAKGPTTDVAEFYKNFMPQSNVLDVGCGEGRNSIFLSGQCHKVDAFDLSEAGIEKAKYIAAHKGLDINFFVCDLNTFVFNKDYDVILSHGVLHLPEKAVRDRFIAMIQEHTKPGGYNIIGVFTNRVPATPDNAPFTKSLFDVGELPSKYIGWKILSHDESILHDSHPGGVSHEHAYEWIIARKLEGADYVKEKNIRCNR